MSDIFDGLAQVRITFKREGFEPPCVMLLESHEQGVLFLNAVRQTPYWQAMVGDPSLGQPIEMADGSVWMEIQAMGFKIRWPANKVATPDGSWSYA